MAANRNELSDNLIENNGAASGPIGVWVRGQTRDLILKDNRIRDTRPSQARAQPVGIRLDPSVGPLKLERNTIETTVPLDDQRPTSPAVAPAPR